MMYSKWIKLFIVFSLAVLFSGCKGDSSGKDTVQKNIAKSIKHPTKVSTYASSGHKYSDDENRTTGRPKIEFERTEYDFGEIEQGEKVEHIFKFKNTGDSTLVIKKVRSS